ncbi:hypothetical protein [Cryobacterium sp. PAMC25264]|uniref:hypothetical protein n=1 Tax=Cryobacterium sp. PAMC25264 TaxID=2861288 RepID=UPI001C62B13C|nr:hypothetical protein [Cryobacterium sp. PAMC25264]QYF73209.1 hypothetical protein KY500_15945 [Cryobacterium sp. PAMC25264]
MGFTAPQPPSGAAETFADALRALALVGIVVAGVGWGPVAGVSVSLVAGGMVLSRLAQVRPSVDIAFGVVLLVAVWSSVLDLYVTVRWWDIPMHFLTNGLCAVLLYLVLVRLGVLSDTSALPRPVASAVTMTTALGFSLGFVWEIFEWLGHTFVDDAIYVGYTDTIGDLVWGGAGSMLAGFTLVYLAATPRRPAGDSSPHAVEALERR